jgi:hypothetical protein
LEIESGLINKEYLKKIFFYEFNNKNYNNSTNNDILNNSIEYVCALNCFTLNQQKIYYNNNNNDYNNKSSKNINKFDIDKWLNKIGLIHLKKKFIENGFDYFEYFILQMFSSIPIDENILINDIKIYDDFEREKIILRLNKDVKFINNNNNNNNFSYNYNNTTDFNTTNYNNTFSNNNKNYNYNKKNFNKENDCLLF